jgi:hypothetical protein
VIAAASPRPATPILARILKTWMLALFGGDEQRLADLLVSPAGSHFAETLAYYSQAQAMRQARAPGQSLHR